jgi:hypothetical protein
MDADVNDDNANVFDNVPSRLRYNLSIGQSASNQITSQGAPQLY